MNVRVLKFGILAICVGVCPASPASSRKSTESWNPSRAAAYLDSRMEWWAAWPGAARDHSTFCVSCHTPVAYALARPILRAAAGEPELSPNERLLLDNVTKRVRLWNEVKPFYGGVNSVPSRATEAVLNALILASYKTRGSGIDNDVRAAFTNMWSLQQTGGTARGAWEWIQFDNEPWEAHDSQYYGAAMAALAAGTATGIEPSSPQIKSQLQSLREYLNREFARQSPINQAVVLWAAADWPDLLASSRRSALIKDLTSRQQADGGWTLASLVWTWKDWSVTTLAKLWAHSEATPMNPKSDGYATGLIALALERSGVPLEDPHVRRAREWLISNQNEDGKWPAFSPNGKRDHSYGEGLFMNDAATAYAVLALTAK